MSKRHRIKGCKPLGIEVKKRRRVRRQYPKLSLWSSWKRDDGATVVRVFPITRKFNRVYIPPKKVRQGRKEAA